MKAAPEDPTGYMTSSENTIGNLFYGSQGYLAKDVKHWQAYMGQKRELGQSGQGHGNHYKNFIKAIRNNDPKNYNKGIEEGFYSCALVHLANISYRLGRSLDFDPKTMKFTNDAEANGMLKRKYRKPFVVPDVV